MWGKRIFLALTLLTLSIIGNACAPTPLDPVRAFLQDLVAKRWPDGRYIGDQQIGAGETPYDEEWIVFYRKQDRASDPIECTVYWLGVEHCQPGACDEMPSFVAYDLPECACEHECQVEKRDLLSEHDGDELVIWDKDNDQQTKLHAYTWITGTQAHYSLVAYFFGNDIEAEKDWIQARVPIPGAAQIEFRCEYSLLQKELIYRNESEGTCGFDFSESVKIPQHALQSPHPEMVVLAYYQGCEKPDDVKQYFTDAGWESVGKGEGELWSCLTASESVTSTRVVDMGIEEKRSVPGQLGDDCPVAYQVDCPEDVALVITTAEWDDKQGDDAKPTTKTETWMLLWKENGWRIESLLPEDTEVGMSTP